MKATVFALVLVAIIGFAAAADVTFAESYPDGHIFCKKNGFKRVDRTAYYKVNTPVVKAICVLDFYDVCYTVSGAQPCNRAHSKCHDVGGNWDDAVLSPASANTMTMRPQACVAEGAYWGTEVAVHAVAQPVVAWLVLLAVAIIVIQAAKGAGASGLSLTFLGLQFMNASFLIFSFWYLNAYLAMLVSSAAVGLYATKNRAAISIGMICVFLGLLWFTYASGLGYAQHGARYEVQSHRRYDAMCNNFYRGYFEWPMVLHGAYNSPNIVTHHYCSREWLAVELFFIFFTELTFLLILAVGAFSAGSKDEERNDHGEPVESEAAPEASS